MSDPRIFEYIKYQLQRGINKEDIRSDLVSNGWPAEEVEQALAEAQAPTPTPSPPPSLPTMKESEQALLETAEPQLITASSSGKLAGSLTIFSETCSLYKKRLKTLVGITAIPLLVQFIISIITGVILAASFTSLLPSLTKPNADLFSLLTTIVPLGTVAVIELLIVIVLQIWNQIALVCAIQNENEPIGIIESYRRAWHKILSYYWVVILSGLIIFGGLLLFIIPGLIMSLWFSFAVFVVIAENEKGLKAIIKSREYARGNWWQIFWRLLVVAAIALLIGLGLIVVYVCLALLSAALSTILHFSLISAIILGAAQIAVMLFLPPLFVIYPFLLYRHLKDKKGAFQFQPTGKQKAGFVIISLIGIILIIGGLVLLFSLIKNFNQGSNAPNHSLIGGITGFDSAQSRARDARVQSAIAQARTVMVYGFSDDGNYSNLNCQNTQLTPICSEVKSESYQGSDLIIGRSSNQQSPSACLYAPLNEQDGQTWYCADSQGNAGTTDINPSATCRDGLASVSCPNTIAD
ncbi:MAG: hypothetical protein PHN39_01200 [Candidatus Pacebacteria bacterium]|nr:hypothetical protein [Candidatus Paceibacterota bacterium]